MSATRPPGDELFDRHPANPIVVAGLSDGPAWRRIVTFNPGVCRAPDGRFWMYERAAGSLTPFVCHIGALVSEDGVHFELASDTPVVTPADLGSPFGSAQDARVVHLDGQYVMTFAWRPLAQHFYPTGIGVPDRDEPTVDGAAVPPEQNKTRSAIAVATDPLDFKFHAWATPENLDDRDVILFPEKIGGRYAMLRRPLELVGPEHGTEHPSIWITFGDDLAHWDEPRLLAKPAFDWEDNRIGGSTPPLRTDAGWLVLYHGVQNVDAAARHVRYKLGAMLLDVDDPRRVIARTPEPIMTPTHYYERFGLFIPDVVFPTANVVVDGVVHLYYGCCDTSIGLATCPLDRLVEHVRQFPWSA